jgi:glycosyltransferase involved in cell wall biosynthesis
VSATPHRRLGRVLMTLPSTGIGGAEAHSAVLAGALVAQGVDLRLAIEAPQIPALARMLGPGLAARLVAAPIGWDREAAPEANIARQAEATAALLATLRPEAAILPLPWPTHGLGVQAALAAAGLPSLAIAHLAPREPEPATEAAVRALPQGGGGGALWAAVSAPVAARVAACFGLPPGAVAVVPNGIAVPGFDPVRAREARAARRLRLGLAPAAPLLVFAGRLEPNKGADLLPDIAGRAGGATVAALGDGPLDEVLAEAEAARPGGPLRLLGRVTDVPEWLLAADALVLPSRLEGCPLVFLEAAANRCPVVATAAALEAFGDAAHAMAALVPDANAAALAERAAAALAEPEATRRRVEAAWLHAATADQGAMLRRYAGLLRAALAGGGRA